MSLFKVKACVWCRKYLVSEVIRQWLLRFRDDALWTLQETRGFQVVLLTLPLRLHDQLWLAEGVWGGGVGGDRLDDDAVAGAEAVRLKTHTHIHTHTHTRWGVTNKQPNKHQKHCADTDRQAVEDDVFVWWGRRARRQGNRAVVAQAERKALTGGEAERQALIGRRLEVVCPRGAGGLQVEGLEEKDKTRKIICELFTPGAVRWELINTRCEVLLNSLT